MTLDLAQPDFFIVGPKYVLRSCGRDDADAAVPFPFVLSARGDGGRQVGHMNARICEGPLIMMSFESRDELPDEDLAELYKLFARVCIRRGKHAVPLALDEELGLRPRLANILADDGFLPRERHLLVRPPRPFVREQRKASDMNGVYADPFFIPWNFVPRELDALEPLLSRGPGERQALRVLDLGCGFGKNSTFMEESGFQVFGVDISEAAVARCRELVKHPRRFVVGSATALPWAADEFDCVVDVGCLHCLDAEARRLAVEETWRVLRPGGVIYSRTFKPRGSEWLKAQPFQTSQFGLTEEEALGLFARRFDCDIWKSDREANYVRCFKGSAL